MGYAIAIGSCFCCKTLFAFNPELVPSIRLNAQGKPDPAGTRQPICQSCVERANHTRESNGLEPITILPGAYEEETIA